MKVTSSWILACFKLSEGALWPTSLRYQNREQTDSCKWCGNRCQLRSIQPQNSQHKVSTSSLVSPHLTPSITHSQKGIITTV
ncbi:hypothetical protein EJ06DRAFT_402333 [Trichodelitschia bisporula]|uniref:Uncharacterized protein n=1 Tax=Trichodelitschia bisporula TaxID=703511 RepID=A0A6G1HY73_9PEZI|nr:hypothetical protein EJ06DRAFT_402333 [Trichodelitschia bisporula]